MSYHVKHPKKARAAGEAAMRNPAGRTAAFARLRAAGKIPPEPKSSDSPTFKAYCKAVTDYADDLMRLVDEEANKYLPPLTKKST